MPDGATSVVFRTARRAGVGLLVGFSGPSGSGKTVSALRFARGLAGPTGKVALLDTERGRALHYAGMYDFLHAELNEPFRPSRYAEAAEASKRAGHDVLIIDSMSHEHAGPGGLLDMHEEELDRMAGNDLAKRERVKMTAWIKPKVEHKAMVQRLLQLNCHLVLCFRAEEKTELVKNDKGRTEPRSLGFQPICGKDMPYELTIMLGLDPARPGVPIPLKVQAQHARMIPPDLPVNEDAGARLAAWARGEVFAEKPAPRSEAVEQEKRVEDGAKAIGAMFAATTDRAAHNAIVDDPEVQKQIGFLKRSRKELYQRHVEPALKASWTRTAAKGSPEEQQNLV